MAVSKGNRGFTTLELAMVLIVFGLVTATVMAAFAVYNRQQSDAQTQLAFDTSEAGVLAFQSKFGRYPCPASPTAARGSASYGREQRNAGTGLCTNTAGVIRVTANGIDYDPATPGDDTILIGSVPFNSMLNPDNNAATNDGIRDVPLHDATTYDGFGHRLTYVVSEKLTRSTTYNDFHGAIRVVDENNNPLVLEKEDDNDNDVLDPGEDDNGNGVLDNGNYAHVALISHGDNGRGARTPTGTLVEACPPSLPVAVFPEVASAVNEVENCDNTDATLLSGLRYESGHSYNDDTVKFLLNETSGLWSYVAGSTTQIKNNNTGGNVGFGTNNPTEKLDIAGRMRADWSRSDQYCDDGGTDCLDPETLGGDVAAMQCDPGEVIVSISESAVNCVPAFTGGFAPKTCPVDCYASGFTINGSGNTTVVCRHKSTLAICP